MLTREHYYDIQATRKTIEHINEGEATRIPLSTAIAIIDFILVGIKSIFFDKTGNPKGKWQLILSLPAIIKFIVEVIGMITAKIKRKPTASIPAKTIKAISDGVGRTNA